VDRSIKSFDEFGSHCRLVCDADASLARSCRSLSIVTLENHSHSCASRALPVYFELELEMPTGTVKWFNESKGFGFIKPDDGGADLFAHYSGIKAKGFRTLKENQKVQYEVQQGQKGPQAVEIDIVA
jgi:CspA family cold shock protein